MIKKVDVILTKEHIFDKQENNKVYDNFLRVLIEKTETEGTYNDRVTILCRKGEEENTYNVVAASGNEFDKIEWYVFRTYIQKDLVKHPISNYMALQNFLQNCVTQIEAEHAKC
jgi:hypothetical protein